LFEIKSMTFGKKRDNGYVWNLACLVIGSKLVAHGRKDMCTKDKVGWTTSVSTLSLSLSLSFRRFDLAGFKPKWRSINS